MKNLVVFLLLTISVGHAANSMELIDKAVAIVNDQVILESELRLRLDHVNFLNAVGDAEDENTLSERVLDVLIDEQLQYHIAQRANVNVTEQEVATAMEDFNQRLQSNDQSLNDYMNALGIDREQVLERVRIDLSIQKVQRGSLNRRITITSREIDQFLESKAGQEWLQPRFNLGHILLPFSLSPGNENALASQANQLRTQLITNNASFKQAAVQFSKGPNAAKGGDLGWNAAESLPELFVQQVSSLKPGQVTPVFRSNAGFHILKLYQRSGAESVFVERSEVRHILVATSELFTDAEAQAKINRLYQAIENGADFETLAQEETDDTASKLGGGYLGWSTPGQFVPNFERVMDATAVGEYSEPFRSQFGWHILKVENRRMEDMFETVKRSQVRNILRNQRLQDELQIWLIELRENAFIQKIS